ncbi:MAG: hypothetical protein M0C28_24590 [Candidatus Moduliflexus flocculans]|nr:hypothetical protein [Candidatus Moduliflexus flocculans]
MFLFVQPLQRWRQVNVTSQRTKQDFAQQMRLLVDQYFPTAERIRLVVDNLNTHTPRPCTASFRRPKPAGSPASWSFTTPPSMAVGSIWPSASWPCSPASVWIAAFRTIDTLREEIAAWQGPRNQRQTKIHWQFGTDVARVKLKRLYPSVEPTEDPVGPEEVSEPVKTFASIHS